MVLPKQGFSILPQHYELAALKNKIYAASARQPKTFAIAPNSSP